MESSTEFRNLDALPGYRVGSDGSIWSCMKRVRIKYAPWVIGTEWRQLQPVNVGKYLAVEIRGKQHKVHTLVLLAFIGPCPADMECCHGDGNPHNNRPENLRWGTRKSNGQDRVKHGRSNYGRANCNAKFTDERVAEVRAEFAAGEINVTQLAKKHHISQQAMHCIIKRKTWKHVV